MRFNPCHFSGFFYFMTTQTIDRLVQFSRHIQKISFTISEKDAFNLAIEIWKADSLDTIAE